MSTRAESQIQLMRMYDSLPGGQTEKERRLYGFIPGEWLPQWVKQGYNQSIEGMARQIMNGESVFKVDENYDLNMLEDIAATVMSFATPTDFATLALGGGIGGAAVRGAAVKGLTKEFSKRGLTEHFAKRKLATSGLNKSAAARAVNMSAPKILNQARAKAVTGGTGLGFYSGLQSALGQKVTYDDVDVVRTLQDAAKGATLGALTGGIGGKVQQAVTKAGMGKVKGWGVEKGVETGVFGTASPLLEGELPSAESYIHAAGVIGGLSLKRAITSRAIRVPKDIMTEAVKQEQLRSSAAFEARAEATRLRGKEEWSDGKRNVRILTDYTNKESKKRKFVLENLDTKKSFKIPKDEFFKQYTRTKDKFGRDVDTEIRNRIFGAKDKIKMDDVEFKEAVDRAAFGKNSEESFPLKKRTKGKKGYHSNYNKLETKEQKYRLLMELEASQKVGEILDGYKKAGIEVKDVSRTSLLKKALPESVYSYLQGKKKAIVKIVAPEVYQLTDPTSKSAKQLMDKMSSRNSILFSRLATELNNAKYIDKSGNEHTFGNLSSTFKGGRKAEIRREMSFDLETKDMTGRPLEGEAKLDALNRTAELRKVMSKTWKASGESGLDLAPFVENYFPRIIKPDVLKVLYKDIDRMSDLDPRVLSSDLVKKPGFEDNLKRAMDVKEISQKTIDTLNEIRLKIIQEQQKAGQTPNVSLSQAFEVLRNGVISERIVLNKALEKERGKIELPESVYERDAGYVLTNYLAQATKRIAYAEIVGKDGRIMYDKIKALHDKRLGGQAEIIKRAFDTYTGLIETDPKYNWSYTSKKRLNDLVNFHVATKIGLGFATIPNITQTFISTALKLGYAPFFKGTWRAIKDKKYREAVKKNSGAGTLELHQMIAGFHPQQASLMGRIADVITKASQFQRINRVNKLVSAFSALEAVKGWQKIAKIKPKTLRQAKRRDRAIRNLREMGIKDINAKMTPKKMARAMHEFSRDTQLQKNVFLEPTFFNNPKFQPFILFKRFGYRQAEMMGRWAHQALKDKDMAFFLRLGAAGMAGGAFVNWSKAMLSNLLSGEDVYNADYKLNVDGTDYTMGDFIQGLMAVGSFGVVTDIVAAENPWRSFEFFAKPVILQDASKLYDAMLRIGTDMEELGPNSITARRAAKYVAPVFGTMPKRLARLAETPKQRADRRRTMLTSTKKKIFDYMLSDNDTMVKRLVREWNLAFPERPLMMDDIGVEEINKYLMRKYTRLEREMVDPAMQPSKSKRKSPVWR